MINYGTIVGRLVDDPLINFTPGGKPVANFKIASARPYKDEAGNKPTDFIPVVVWGEQAKFIADHGKKGKMVAASGRYQSRSYDHAQYPIKVYVIELNAEEVQLIEWDDNGQAPGGQQSGGYSQQNGGYSNQGGYQQQGQQQSQQRNQGGYQQNQRGSQQRSQGGYQQQGGNQRSYQQQPPQGGYQQQPPQQQQQGSPFGNQPDPQYTRYHDPFKNGQQIDISDDDLPF